MSFAALVWAFKQTAPRPPARHVLLVLSNCANGTAICWPSVKKIRDYTGYSERTVQVALGELEKLGLLHRHARYDRGRQTSTLYRLALPDASTDDDDGPGPGVQELHRVSAGDASLGVQELHRVGAGDAPKSVNEPTVELRTNNQGEEALSSSTPVGEFPDLSADDAEKAREYWNALAERYLLPTLKIMTENRRLALSARLREHADSEGWDNPLAGWIDVLRRIARSSFLTGENDRAWSVSFDFIVEPDHFLRLLEGSYGGQEV